MCFIFLYNFGSKHFLKSLSGLCFMFAEILVGLSAKCILVLCLILMTIGVKSKVLPLQA
jgi:hypothetical protein